MPNLSQKQLLEKYVNAVLSAPHSLALTAARDHAEFWERHVLDSLKLVELLPKDLQNSPRRVIDIGSGNGTPGIPAAIAIPQWHITMLDSNNKKCGFLDMFCKFNAIENAIIIADRAEVLGRREGFRDSFDLAFARALGKLPVALEYSVPFLKRGGLLIIPHGASYKSELERSKNALKELGAVLQSIVPYALNKDVTFNALIFLKQHATPERYPRKSGIPQKRPL